MDTRWFADLPHLLMQSLVPFGTRLAGAIALWIIGGWVIRAVKTLSRRGMAARGQKILPTKIKIAVLGEDWFASKSTLRDTTMAEYRAWCAEALPGPAQPPSASYEL